MKAVDLFAGAGGFSTGARMAGATVVWAANHWPLAVEFGRDHPYSHQPTKPHGDAERIAAAHAKRERKNARRKAAKAIPEGGTSNA